VELDKAEGAGERFSCPFGFMVMGAMVFLVFRAHQANRQKQPHRQFRNASFLGFRSRWALSC
jgi:hypothetical protein